MSDFLRLLLNINQYEQINNQKKYAPSWWMKESYKEEFGLPFQVTY